MEIINPEEEPLDWEPGGKKRRPDKNPWQPDKQFPDQPYGPNPYEKDPSPFRPGPLPGDPPDPDDPWPGRKPQDPNPYGPPGGPDPHKRWEKPGKKTCPGCGGSGEVHEDDRWSSQGDPDHRGQQFGRKGHFGAGTGSDVQG
jgi:hypothetical protein